MNVLLYPAIRWRKWEAGKVLLNKAADLQISKNNVFVECYILSLAFERKQRCYLCMKLIDKKKLFMALFLQAS